MSSIKQLIINAIIKVSGENPALDGQSEFSAVEARDDFIRLLMLELFPEETSVVTVSTEPVAAAAKSPKKAKKSKVAKTEEPAAPAPAPASPAKSPKDAKAEAKAAAAAAKEAEKATKAAEKEAAKAAKTAAKEAKKATPPASPVKAASPKKAAKAPKAPKVVKPAEDSNLPKMDPTWRKHLKKADKAATKESESELLTYLNALTKEEFNAKKAEDHVAQFVASRAAAPAAAVADDGKESADLTEIDFEGKTYFVNPESKRVYEGEGEYDDEVGWTSYKPVGYVGMAVFEKMEV